jgi:hypothetical protein
MKCVIDGKVYDTETAEELHSWDNGHYDNDFRSCSETLYRTAKGNYFLAGEGGPMTEYAIIRGDGKGWGEEIRPLTEQEAMEWLETHDGSDVLMEEFANALEEA